MELNRLKWYGKECLEPKYTKLLMNIWQAPPGNTAARYYSLFPKIEPFYLPEDHYIVQYNVADFPKNRDYRKFKEMPAEIKSTHIVEWEDTTGPCNLCEICLGARRENARMKADYYRRLEAWKTNGIPM